MSNFYKTTRRPVLIVVNRAESPAAAGRERQIGERQRACSRN
jgi:hypothetical protein